MDSGSSSFDFTFQNMYQHITALNACKALALILGLHMIQVGLWVFWDPASCVKAFGLRLDGKPFHTLQTKSDNLQKKVRSAPPKSENDDGNFWTLMFAPREVGFGLLVLVFAGLGEWRATGITVAVVAGLLATSDGVATGLYGKDGWPGAVKGHGIPALLLGAVAGGLLVLE